VAAREKSGMVAKKWRNLLRLRQIHHLEEGGGDGKSITDPLLRRNKLPNLLN
jgi:hypothetical protein